MQQIRQWEAYLRATGKSPHTIRAYGQGVENFRSFCKSLRVDPLQVDDVDAVRYLTYLQGREIIGVGRLDKPLATATIKARLAGLNSLYSRLLSRGDMQSNPFSSLVKDYRHFQGEIWLPQPSQWQQFLGEVRKEPLRNRLMVCFAYEGALRRETLVNLERRDVDFDNGNVYVRKENSKGNRGETVVRVSKDILWFLLEYLKTTMSLKWEHGLDVMPLFRSTSNRNLGDALTPSAWNKVVSRIAKQAGLPRFSTHTFRHLRLTHMAEAGVDVLHIARYAGHSSTGSTMRYIHLSGREIAQKVAVNELMKREQLELTNRALKP